MSDVVVVALITGAVSLLGSAANMVEGRMTEAEHDIRDLKGRER